MEFLILFLLLIVFIETTITLVKTLQNKPLRSGRRKVYVDTSALMDGRILSVAQTGFINDDLIIPRSVIRELQILADGRDDEKRARARMGLDVANELGRVIFIDTTILQDDLDHTPVDERLIELAKKNHGAILTCDFNLGKVAKTEKIDVLNINDLALMLRSEHLPGEKLRVKITATGNSPKQGVGYLSDGTMVVVDNASKKVGKTLDVEFIKFLQTSAGKMAFAKIVQKSVARTNLRQSQIRRKRQ